MGTAGFHEETMNLLMVTLNLQDGTRTNMSTPAQCKTVSALEIQEQASEARAEDLGAAPSGR